MYSPLRTPDGEPPYVSCLPYNETCARQDTSRRVAGAKQDAPAKDDLRSLLTPSLRTKVGETSILAVVAVAAGAGERERSNRGKTNASSQGTDVAKSCGNELGKVANAGFLRRRPAIGPHHGDLKSREE